ncbi:MAG: hypothetical protein M3065_14035 [Actinomycetota bacterium]|nr:hypothetical protein [Actinomycetota bacterium]
MTDEDLTIIEEAGRRCAVCHTGRRWRDFQVVRPENAEPVVMCAACTARYGEKPPVAVAEPQPEPVAAPEPEPEQKKPARRSRPRQSEDRLKRALRELPPGEHSTGRIAKAAGLNHAKVLSRLHALQEAGEVRQIGKHWSADRPSTDLEAAFDRLQARTGNLRIVRETRPSSSEEEKASSSSSAR